MKYISAIFLLLAVDEQGVNPRSFASSGLTYQGIRGKIASSPDTQGKGLGLSVTRVDTRVNTLVFNKLPVTVTVTVGILINYPSQAAGRSLITL